MNYVKPSMGPWLLIAGAVLLVLGALAVVEVFREGQRVAQLGAGTSVGEMAYLAPSPDLRVHSADVIVAEPATTITFTPWCFAEMAWA